MGVDGKEFKMWKFRSMVVGDANHGGWTVKDDPRVTRVGRVLRKTNLDELPQLWNVLVGQMSLVGPRPLLIEYLKKYSNHEKKRHLVKPGITGLAQVNPDPTGVKSWKKSIKLDVYYAKNLNLFLDIKILFKTVDLILFKKKQYKDFKKFYE